MRRPLLLIALVAVAALARRLQVVRPPRLDLRGAHAGRRRARRVRIGRPGVQPPSRRRNPRTAVRSPRTSSSTEGRLGPRRGPFLIDFDNKDAGRPHNIDIKDASGAEVFKGTIVKGPGTATTVPAIATGNYTFVCAVHSNMSGTLVAG